MRTFNSCSDTLRYCYTMTLHDFNILELNERMEAVNQYGTFLDNHVSKTERSNLYAIDIFFVEVVYNPEYNTITEVKSFKTGH
jgi:hypothetical protein